MPRRKGKNRKAAKVNSAVDSPLDADPAAPYVDPWLEEYDNDATKVLKYSTGVYEKAADFVHTQMKVVGMECRIDHIKDPRAELGRLGAVKDLVMLERARIEEKEMEVIRFMKTGFDANPGDRNDPIGIRQLVEIDKATRAFDDAREKGRHLTAQLDEYEGRLYESLALGLESGHLKPLAEGSNEEDRVKKLLLQLDHTYRAVASRDTRIRVLGTKLQQEHHVRIEFQQALMAIRAQHQSTCEELTEIKHQLDRERSASQNEKKALEELHRAESEQANARTKQLEQSVSELRSKLQHREVSENIANLQQHIQRNGANFEREKKVMQERHLREMEKANGQIRRLQQDLAEVECYSHDLERYRTEMSDARDQVESLRAAVRGADDENSGMKRSMDQLVSDYERGSVASANENRQLLEQLAAERTKVDELTERTRTLSEAGPNTAAPNDGLNNEAFKTFRDQVYVTQFGNHDRYASIEQLLSDLREDHGMNGDEIARNYGYDSLPEFLRSREMTARISIGNGPNGAVYKGIPNETNAHLREAHQISSKSHAAQNANYVRRSCGGCG